LSIFALLAYSKIIPKSTTLLNIILIIIAVILLFAKKDNDKSTGNIFLDNTA